MDGAHAGYSRWVVQGYHVKVTYKRQLAMEQHQCTINANQWNSVPGYCECANGIKRMEKDCAAGVYSSCADACRGFGKHKSLTKFSL